MGAPGQSTVGTTPWWEDTAPWRSLRQNFPKRPYPEVQSSDGNWARQYAIDQYADIQAQQRAEYEAEQQQKNMADQEQLAAAAQSQQQQIYNANLASLQAPAPVAPPEQDLASRRAGGGFFGSAPVLGNSGYGLGNSNGRNTFLGA